MLDYEKRHLEILREYLAECTVLLKSDGAFPLQEPCKIAAYGSGVRNTIKGGTGSGEVNSRFSVTIEQGLTEARFEITTKDWLDAYDETYVMARKEFAAAMKTEAKAKKVDSMMYALGKVMPEPEYLLPLNGEGNVAIYVLARNSGEGNDRDSVSGDIKLSVTEKRDILNLNAKYEKFMLVLNVGGAVDLSEIDEVKNILVLSQLGVDTGAVLADVLLGKANPSGKLTTTWAEWEDYATMGQFGEHNDTRYNEGIYVGYRYFDSVGKKALYPFGYGKSYTEFSLDVDEVSLKGSEVTVKASVNNIGLMAGKETVQVYVSSPVGRLDKPYQALAGFEKTASIEPKAKEQICITFDLCDLASYDTAQAAYVLEKGNYVIRVGTSSVDTNAKAIISVKNDIVVTKVRSAFGTPDFEDWKPETIRTEKLPENLPILVLKEECIKTKVVNYDAPEPVDEVVKKLSNEELAYVNVGAFNKKGGALSVIGNASTHIAGAAGETTGILIDKGFPITIMADGPAGLRLCQKFYRDKDGVHGIGQSFLPDSCLDFMSLPMRLLVKLLSGKSKAPKGAVVEYQYCTAIPIGTAIAQSWNIEFARICGDIVGNEMERFGVNFWLAPALNIHRTIRCGRNFEYYSEDPLMSGKMAAAITVGVQAHPGCATTIKHYAANNQETNRYGNNSAVSERALREIYLKGFGICIRESQPCSVMSSYNLINGQHTAERRDLCQDILRCEFGFDGVLMSDWIIGGDRMNSKEDIYAPVRPHKVAVAGGDLFMPGDKADYDDIMSGIEKGVLKREQLEINATRVYRMVNRLAGKEDAYAKNISN